MKTFQYQQVNKMLTSSNKIFLFQPIFAPDAVRTQRNIDSIRSIAKSMLSNLNIEKFAFGGWGRDDYYKFVETEIRKIFPSNRIYLNKFSENFGKAHVVNSLIEKNKENISSSDILLLCDSDILFPAECENFIEKARKAYNIYQEKCDRPAGFIAFNQKGQNCHLMEKLVKIVEVRLDDNSVQSVRIPEEPSGIAGGCILTSHEIWMKVGGYRELGVYAGDDAHYLLDSANSGGCYGMLEDLSVEHPHDCDIEYSRWKHRVAHEFVSGTSDSVLHSRRDAETFWNGRTSEEKYR